jgi:hypothetical protein
MQPWMRKFDLWGGKSMVRINNRRTGADHGDIDIKIDRNSIEQDQFLEIATAKSVRIESIKCGGIKIPAKKIFLDGDIVSSGPVIPAAMKIYINKEAPEM